MSTNLPQHARERLQGMRTAAHSSGVFTSDFTVNEFLLVRKAGFEPIGMCVGSCVYHVGIQYRAWSKNQELDVLSKAMYHARELAMERMRAEAKAMGADGIVGVKLTIKRMEWDNHMLEFIAIGTGVVHARDTRASGRTTEGRSRRTCQARTSGRCCTPVSPRRDGHGVVCLSCRAPRHARVLGHDQQQCRIGKLHGRDVRGARNRDRTDAGRSRHSQGGRRRRHGHS